MPFHRTSEYLRLDGVYLNVGKLGDLYGRKSLFEVALVIFLIGSVLCGSRAGAAAAAVLRSSLHHRVCPGLILGFAMFGAITFLSLFLQVVQGAGPPESGLRLLPMMVGLLLTSTISGRLISRWGRFTYSRWSAPPSSRSD
jgi:MFS family permease